jgi:predicted transglutaminase-like cysteine proteinase
MALTADAVAKPADSSLLNSLHRQSTAIARPSAIAFSRSSGCQMVRSAQTISLLTVVAAALFAATADARSRLPQDSSPPAPIVESSPTLAPFQHVRFCLHYPPECKSEAPGVDRIDVNADVSDLLKRVNHDVNTAIAPTVKSYGTDLRDGWTIAPAAGDCNDYAVTKRHDLVESGLPAKALRLSVVKTASGTGHLVLVVATTKGDLVLDNLTEEIRPWQSTNYQWLKIQSAADARFWYEVKVPGAGTRVSQANR